MGSQTIGALARRPTGNAQGSYFFFYLSTGRIITRNHATKLPMPDHVIDAVHRLARRQNADPGLAFANGEDAIGDDVDENDDNLE